MQLSTLYNRLSAVLHVLYKAINRALNGPQEEGDDEETSENIIAEETAQMAVHLTHYFQAQRSVYEQVSVCYVTVSVLSALYD